MLEQSRQYYLYRSPVDMRKSFFTLGAIVRQQMQLEAENGSGYVFINRRKTHLKLLRWEGDGWSIYYKRLEQGTFEHPNVGQNHQISYEKLLLILRGIESENIVKRKRFCR